MRLVTVVTGGSRGIGAATARRLAAVGHDVVISYLSEVGAADAVAKSVTELGRRCRAVRADVSVEEDVERLFGIAATELGQVTGLVNNAGITSPVGRLADASVQDLRRVVEVNLIGCLLCSRRAAQVMSLSRGGAGGAIVNISSGAATLGGAGEYIHYAATKAAVDTLTIGLAQELAPDGIRVNAVVPGLVRTEIHGRGTRDAGRLERLAPQIPMGRAAEPDEIAAPIVWLLGPEASYTTGAVLRVAGGR